MAQLTDDCFAFGGPLMTIEEAARLMADRLTPAGGIEEVPLAQADGRVLAADLIAPIPLPPFANSAVDGYAVRHAGLLADAPTRMPVSARVAAGQVAGAEERGAVRIFTGAPMPEGCDTVFMQEDVERAGDQVTLPPGLKRGANMRPAGEDIAEGARALEGGTRLGPAELAVAAALGLTSVTVRNRLKVGIFSTGDELRDAGERLGPAAIHDSNRILLMALVRRAGCEPVDLGIIRDVAAELAARLKAATASCDVILTSGGVSTGEEDHVKPAVEQIGRLVFWRIAIKPGRPVAMGVIGGKPFVGLPGNPVAVFVTFAFVVRPMLARLSGALWREPRRMIVTSRFGYAKKAGRREYVRVRLLPRSDGGFDAVKHSRDGAGVLSSLTETDGLLELPDAMTRLAEGDEARFLAYRDLM